jgi:hypothetical protein
MPFLHKYTARYVLYEGEMFDIDSWRKGFIELCQNLGQPKLASTFEEEVTKRCNKPAQRRGYIPADYDSDDESIQTYDNDDRDGCYHINHCSLYSQRPTDDFYQ